MGCSLTRPQKQLVLYVTRSEFAEIKRLHWACDAGAPSAHYEADGVWHQYDEARWKDGLTAILGESVVAGFSALDVKVEVVDHIEGDRFALKEQS